MTIEEARADFERHVKEAYYLLPTVLIPPAPHIKSEWIQQAFDRSDWSQVLGWMHTFQRGSKFSDELPAKLEASGKSGVLLATMNFEIIMQQMSHDEMQLIGECLSAIVDGSFIPEWEFQTIMGLNREQVAEIAAQWPSYEPNGKTYSAVNNTLNNLRGYPHGKEQELRDRLSVTPDKFEKLCEKWFTLRRQLRG